MRQKNLEPTLRALTTTSTFVALAMASVACNFATDLDEVRDNALERRAPDREPSEQCIEYCELSAANCDGSAATRIYDTLGACLAACELFPHDGVEGETSGDTVNCRITHLTLAEFDAVHCRHGSPDGGGICAGPSPCGTYCAAVIENCTGPHEVDFAGDADLMAIYRCLVVCNDTYDQSGTPGDTSGDTLQCRQTAAGLTPNDPGLFCPQAAPDGGGVCVD